MSQAPPIADLDAAHVASLVPRRDPDGHKGTFGRVAIVAGSLDYAGAALLVGTAALRGGAGLASLFVPASLQPLIAGRVPELITRGLPEVAPGQVDPVAAAATIADEPHDALVIGPGLAPDRRDGACRRPGPGGGRRARRGRCRRAHRARVRARLVADARYGPAS